MQTELSRDTESKAPAVRVETILKVVHRVDQWNAEFTIMPAQAKAILNTIRKQRPVRPAKVEFWRKAILSGEALATHQGMAVDVDGSLLDGQHRLLGCVAAGKPFRVLVFFNRPRQEFKAYDRGAVRTLGDDLVMMGVADGADANVIQAAARLVWHFDHGRVPWITSNPPTSDQIIELLAKHKYLQETAINIYHDRGKGRGIPPAPGGAFFALFREVHNDQAIEFLEQIRNGEWMGGDFPAMVLRNSIERDRSRKYSDARNAFMIRLVHAWNAHLSHRKITTLVSVLRDDKFPKIKGYNYNG